MIYKRCARCGKRLPASQTCSCYDRHKEYSKYRDDDKEVKFYKTNKWVKAKAIVKARCYGLDLYSLIVNHRIEYGDTVHHIVPIKEDWNKRLNIDNLIYLTESNHQMVHNMLNGTREEHDDIIHKLESILNAFKSE